MFNTIMKYWNSML